VIGGPAGTWAYVALFIVGGAFGCRDEQVVGQISQEPRRGRYWQPST
jgi:hypothetical protein